jgi:hypothetical protein
MDRSIYVLAPGHEPNGLKISNHHRGAKHERDAYRDNEEEELAHRDSCGRYWYGALALSSAARADVQGYQAPVLSDPI